MAAQVTEAQLPTSEATREQCDRDEAEQMAEACSSKALMGPNEQGNRPAAPTRTEDQSMCRQVRLTVGLGPSAHDSGPRDRGPSHAAKADAAIGLRGRSAMPGLEARPRNRCGNTGWRATRQRAKAQGLM
jgi:hypothetical protein